MITAKIYMNNDITDIIEFVKAASKSSSDVIVKKGSRVLDGSSLAGMMTLDPAGGIDVTYAADDHEFESFLKDHYTVIGV